MKGDVEEPWGNGPLPIDRWGNTVGRYGCLLLRDGCYEIGHRLETWYRVYIHCLLELAHFHEYSDQYWVEFFDWCTVYTPFVDVIRYRRAIGARFFRYVYWTSNLATSDPIWSKLADEWEHHRNPSVSSGSTTFGMLLQID